MKRGPKPHSILCSVDGCGRRKTTRAGLCTKHYKAEKRRAAGIPARAAGHDAPAYFRRLRYGLEPAQHAALLVAQGGRCAVCRGSGGQRGLAVDHDHSTGRVRGLLCSACNSAIGLLRERAENFERAVAYLKTP
jgi:hypothetical protein